MKKKKFVVTLRVYQSEDACVFEFEDRMALDLMIADIKSKFSDRLEVLPAVGKCEE